MAQLAKASQLAKAFAVKLDDPGSIPSANTVEGDTLLWQVPSDLYTWVSPNQINKCNKFKKILFGYDLVNLISI